MPSFSSANLLLDDATEAARTIELLGNVISSSNLLASDMMAALSANSSAALDPIERAFAVSQQSVISNLEALGKGAGTKSSGTLRKNCWRWERERTASLKFVTGTWTLSHPVRSFSRIPSSSTRHLRPACSNSWLACRTGLLPPTWQARQKISLATKVMLALGGLTVIGSALFVWLYVDRNILRRIGGLQRSMQLLSRATWRPKSIRATIMTKSS